MPTFWEFETVVASALEVKRNGVAGRLVGDVQEGGTSPVQPRGSA